ncbi:MAG: TetR/AcrR family transcriptional regulator [Haliangiales bacterium]
MRTVTERADVVPVVAEVFREHGYDGATLARLSAATGLGRGSLYHFFPGGKAEMAAAVLEHIDRWFEDEIFALLRAEEVDADTGLRRMIERVDDYFRSGGRVCLVGTFALTDSRDRFAAHIQGYFSAWEQALVAALIRQGRRRAEAKEVAEETLIAIQGALVFARGVDDAGAFQRTCERLARRLLRS